jgi:hypothetical protein
MMNEKAGEQLRPLTDAEILAVAAGCSGNHDGSGPGTGKGDGTGGCNPTPPVPPIVTTIVNVIRSIV